MNLNRVCNPSYVYAMKQLSEDEFVSTHSTLMDLRTTQIWFDRDYAKEGIHNALEDFNSKQ